MRKIVKILLFITFYILSAPVWAEDDYKEYGIALVLPQKYLEAAREMNEEIYARLPTTENLPNVFHITLFQGRFLQKQIGDLYKEIKKQNFKKFRIKLKKQVEVVDGRYINWQVKQNYDLEKLHIAIVRIANPYHHGILPRYIDSYNSLSKRQQQQAEEYGMPGLLSIYDPHVTLFYFVNKNSAADAVAGKISIPKFEQGFRGVEVENIIIGEIGYSGNIEKVLYEIPLE